MSEIVKEIKKKMLYLSVHDPHIPYSGPSVRCYNFLVNLSKKFEIDLIYMTGSGHKGDYDLENRFSTLVKLPYLNKKVKVHFSLMNYFLISRQIIKEAEDLLEQTKYDVVLTDYGLSAIYGILMKKKYNIPFIYCSHNIEFISQIKKAMNNLTRMNQLYKIGKNLTRLLFSLWVYIIEKMGVVKCDLLVTISKNDAGYYEKWTNRHKICVVSQGFNEKKFNPFYKTPHNNPKIVLFFGDFNSQHNLEAAYIIHEKVIDEVVAQYPKVKFQFIGINPPKDIKHKHIEFLGFVENIEDYIKKCDIIISPETKSSGMSTKIIESLACGKPIITTKAGARGLSKIFNNLRITYINDFADAVVDVLKKETPVDYDSFRAFQKEFAWSHRINGLAKRIEKTISINEKGRIN